MRFTRNQFRIHVRKESSCAGDGKDAREREQLPCERLPRGCGRQYGRVDEPYGNRIDAVAEHRRVLERRGDEMNRLGEPLHLLIDIYPPYVLFEYVREYVLI